MNKIFDLSKLTINELLAVKSALSGQLATGEMETKAGKLARVLRKENAQLKKLNERRNIVEDNELGWDDGDLWMKLSDAEFDRTVELMLEAKKQGESVSAGRHTMKVPPVIAEPVLNNYEFVRDELRKRKINVR